LLPAVIPAGDPNTGVWFPAADTVAASTAGAERLRITSSGNVGIGTSAPAVKLEVTGAQNTQVVRFDDTSEDGHRYLGFTCSSNGQIWNINSQGDSGGVSGVLSFSTKGTERLRIDSTGKVLIGTTTAGASKLTVADDSIQVNTAKTPASATATGTTGQICWDANYVYVCVATNTWKRSELATW
jgi:hypothetical protein